MFVMSENTTIEGSTKIGPLRNENTSPLRSSGKKYNESNKIKLRNERPGLIHNNFMQQIDDEGKSIEEYSRRNNPIRLKHSEVASNNNKFKSMNTGAGQVS